MTDARAWASVSHSFLTVGFKIAPRIRSASGFFKARASWSLEFLFEKKKIKLCSRQYLESLAGWLAEQKAGPGSVPMARHNARINREMLTMSQVITHSRRQRARATGSTQPDLPATFSVSSAAARLLCVIFSLLKTASSAGVTRDESSVITDNKWQDFDRLAR